MLCLSTITSHTGGIKGGYLTSGYYYYLCSLFGHSLRDDHPSGHPPIHPSDPPHPALTKTCQPRLSGLEPVRSASVCLTRDGTSTRLTKCSLLHQQAAFDSSPTVSTTAEQILYYIRLLPCQRLSVVRHWPPYYYSALFLHTEVR